MSDRHPKWQRVEPGHVIPAGQPYRTEAPDATLARAIEYAPMDRDVVVPDEFHRSWFVDSSWRPPLVLPTEPTWGIVLHRDRGKQYGSAMEWTQVGDRFQNRNNTWALPPEDVLDFIPLTEEQVQRIEAAR